MKEEAPLTGELWMVRPSLSECAKLMDVLQGLRIPKRLALERCYVITLSRRDRVLVILSIRSYAPVQRMP
jgi:hypothetical protein